MVLDFTDPSCFLLLVSFTPKVKGFAEQETSLQKILTKQLATSF